MKKNLILIVLMVLFSIAIVSCDEDAGNTTNGSGDTGNGGGGNGGTGGLDYTPNLAVDNDSTFNLGYYIRGTGKQKEFFNKCEGDTEGNFSIDCRKADPYLPSINHTSLKIDVGSKNTIYQIGNSNDNMSICFSDPETTCST